MSESEINPLHENKLNKNSETVKTEDSFVVINHLNSKHDIKSIVDELLAKNLAGVSSIFVLVPSEDNDVGGFSDYCNSTICTPSEHRTQQSADVQRKLSTSKHELKISAKGQKFFMENLQTTVLSFHNKETMFDSLNFWKFGKKHKHKLCQITTTTPANEKSENTDKNPCRLHHVAINVDLPYCCCLKHHKCAKFCTYEPLKNQGPSDIKLKTGPSIQFADSVMRNHEPCQRKLKPGPSILVNSGMRNQEPTNQGPPILVNAGMNAEYSDPFLTPKLTSQPRNSALTLALFRTQPTLCDTPPCSDLILCKNMSPCHDKYPCNKLGPCHEVPQIHNEPPRYGTPPCDNEPPCHDTPPYYNEPPYYDTPQNHNEPPCYHKSPCQNETPYYDTPQNDNEPMCYHRSPCHNETPCYDTPPHHNQPPCYHRSPCQIETPCFETPPHHNEPPCCHGSPCHNETPCCDTPPYYNEPPCCHRSPCHNESPCFDTPPHHNEPPCCHGSPCHNETPCYDSPQYYNEPPYYGTPLYHNDPPCHDTPPIDNMSPCLSNNQRYKEHTATCPKIKPCSCTDDKLKEMLEQALSSGLIHKKTVGYREYRETDTQTCNCLARPAVPTNVEGTVQDRGTYQYPPAVNECDCDGKNNQIKFKQCETYQETQQRKSIAKPCTDSVTKPNTRPSVTSRLTPVRQPGQTQIIGPAGESMGNKQTKFTSTIGTSTGLHLDYECNHGKKTKKVLSELPEKKIKRELKPEPKLKPVTNPFEWVDLREIKKIKSDLTHKYPIQTKQQLPPPDKENTINDAIRYYTAMDRELFQRLLKEKLTKQQSLNSSRPSSAAGKENKLGKIIIGSKKPNPKVYWEWPERMALLPSRSVQALLSYPLEETSPFSLTLSSRSESILSESQYNKGLRCLKLLYKSPGKSAGWPGLTGICYFDLLQDSFTSW